MTKNVAKTGHILNIEFDFIMSHIEKKKSVSIFNKNITLMTHSSYKYYLP